MFLNTISTDLQALTITSTNWLIVVIIASIIIVGTFVFYHIYHNYNDSTKRTVSIKIDRNGKHRYEINDKPDQMNLLFWLKIIFIIITFGLLFIPFYNWFSKS